MKKYITKKEIKGAKINDYVSDLLEDINRGWFRPAP